MMSNSAAKLDLETFKNERLNRSTVEYFSTFLMEKSKLDALPQLKTILVAILKKEGFLAEYMHITKCTQGNEYLSDFMRNYIDVLAQRIEDKDGFLLAECFFYCMLFVAEKCRLSEHIFLTVLADFVESFGFALADNLFEVCNRRSLKRMEERMRFMLLFYTDDAQVKKLKDSWSASLLLYLFLSSPNSPRAKYLKYEYLREARQDEDRAQRLEEQRNKMPETILTAMLEDDESLITSGCRRNTFVFERCVQEVLKNPASGSFIESLFGLYQSVMEFRRNKTRIIEFSFIKDTILKIAQLAASKPDRTPAMQVLELRVVLALFCNLLTDFVEETMQDHQLIDVVFSNIMDLVAADSAFTKYVGVSVFASLILVKIKKPANDFPNRDQFLRLVKVGIKGLENKPEPNLFSFRPLSGWNQVAAAVNRLVDEQVGDEKRRLTRIQEYLKRVEEEFSSCKNGNNEMNMEVWKFLKKLP